VRNAASLVSHKRSFMRDNKIPVKKKGRLLRFGIGAPNYHHVAHVR